MITIKIKKNSVVIKFLKFYSIYNEGNFNSFNIKQLICFLIKFNKKRALEGVLKEIYKNYKYDEDFEFDVNFKFDKNFIIKLLSYYKNKISFSNKEFNLLLIKEKEDKLNSIINFNIFNEFTNYEEVNYEYEDEYFMYCSTTPIHIACNQKNKKIIELLISYGANINYQNNIGNTPLIEACYRKNNLSVINYLIKNNAKINKRCYNGETALFKACRHCTLDTVKYLIKHGADINLQNNIGNTPLIEACYRFYNIELIEYLIKEGADVNISNIYGVTPLSITVGNNSDSPVLLINHDTDNNGDTPLYSVLTYTNTNIIN